MAWLELRLQGYSFRITRWRRHFHYECFAECRVAPSDLGRPDSEKSSRTGTADFRRLSRRDHDRVGYSGEWLPLHGRPGAGGRCSPHLLVYHRDLQSVPARGIRIIVEFLPSPVTYHTS